MMIGIATWPMDWYRYLVRKKADTVSYDGKTRSECWRLH